MKSANANKFHGKSGGAERRDLRFRGPFVEMFFDRARMARTWRAFSGLAGVPSARMFRLT